MNRLWATLVVAGAACGGLLLGGCGKKAVPGPGGPPPVQVVAVAAQRQPVAEKLSLVGTLAANEAVEVKAEVDGVVEGIHFEEGQRVEAGRLLIQFDETKLAAAVAEAEANYELSRATHERSRQLLSEQLISRQEFDQAAAAFEFNRASLALKRRQLKDARILAPFDGVTGVRLVSPGQVVARNTTLTWLVDLNPVKVEFNVPERFVSRLQPGQSIEIGLAAYPGRRFGGEVFFVSPYVDPATRTALVKARIPNPAGELKPGMFANLDLTLVVRENSVVVPEAAVSRLLEDNRARVFTVEADNTAALKIVQVGMRLPGAVEILQGLEGGERVIVEGVQKIGPGSRVTLAPDEAAAPYLNVPTAAPAASR